jgi:hypothetical protein
MKTIEEKINLVKEKMYDFDLPYTEDEVKELVNEYWIDKCSDEENVNECVLQHQYNIS